MSLLSALCLSACTDSASNPLVDLSKVAVLDMPLDIDHDGRWIAYRRGTETVDAGLYIASIETGEILVHFPDPEGLPVQNARFSTDGRQLAVSRGIGYDLYVIDLDSESERQLTHTMGNARAPEWDPSGEVVLYDRWICRSTDPEGCGLFVIDADGSNEHPLLVGEERVIGTSPLWSSSGRYLSFTAASRVSDRPRRTRIHAHVVDLELMEVRDMTPEALRFQETRGLNWIGEDRLLIASRNPDEEHGPLWSYNVVSEELLPWSLNPDSPFFVISRDGELLVQVLPDQSSSYGILFAKRHSNGTTTAWQITSP